MTPADDGADGRPPVAPRSWPETISYTVMPAIDRTKTPVAARADRFQPRTRVP